MQQAIPRGLSLSFCFRYVVFLFSRGYSREDHSRFFLCASFNRIIIFARFVAERTDICRVLRDTKETSESVGNKSLYFFIYLKRDILTHKMFQFLLERDISVTLCKETNANGNKTGNINISIAERFFSRENNVDTIRQNSSKLLFSFYRRTFTSSLWISSCKIVQPMATMRPDPNFSHFPSLKAVQIEPAE